MEFRIRRLAISGLIALVAFAGAASLSNLRAEDFAGDVPDLIWLDIGGASNQVGSNLTLTGKNGIGASFNPQDVFNMPGTRTAGRMFASARISPKRRYIDFGYQYLNRKGSRDIQQDVDFGGYQLTGGQVTAKFNTGFVYAAFRYDFLHVEQARISGSAGLTWLTLRTGLSGTATGTDPDGNTLNGSFDKSVSTGAPVPMIGLNLDWALTRRLVVRMYSRFFRLNISAFNGGLYESGVRMNWYFAKHFGLGLGYDRTDLNITELKVGDGNILKANYGFSGVGLFINLAF